MTRLQMAFPASILLFTLSIPAAGQSLFENPETAVAPRVGPAHQQPQSPADASVIVVRPELTDEQLADLYMVRKDYREATMVYKRLADQNPRNPVYLNKLGIALHQQTALAMALKYYERASKVDPSYADAQNNIGTIWYQRKKYGKAIKAYQKAIAIRNDMAVLYSNLAYAYFGDKKYEQAIGSFRQALALDPQLFEHNGSRSGSLLQDRSVGDRGTFLLPAGKIVCRGRQSGTLPDLSAQGEGRRLQGTHRREDRSGVRCRIEGSGDSRSLTPTKPANRTS